MGCSECSALRKAKNRGKVKMSWQHSYARNRARKSMYLGGNGDDLIAGIILGLSIFCVAAFLLLL